MDAGRQEDEIETAAIILHYASSIFCYGFWVHIVPTTSSESNVFCSCVVHHGNPVLANSILLNPGVHGPFSIGESCGSYPRLRDKLLSK